MRRRDRFKDLVWIKTLPGDPAEGRVIVPPFDSPSLAVMIQTLIGQHGLFVELEYRDHHYDVKCLPSPLLQASTQVRVSASYTGKSLYSVLASAVRDYATYLSDPDLAILSPRMTIRWVA